MKNLDELPFRERVIDVVTGSAPRFKHNQPRPQSARTIDSGILTLRDYYVEMDASGEWTSGKSAGFTRAPMRRSAPLETSGPETPAFKPNAKVAMDVSPERFFKLLPRLTGAA